MSPRTSRRTAQAGTTLPPITRYADGAGTGPPPWTVTFPLECEKSGAMTPNDLALEFMLFDLSSCIQTDTDPPKAPR